MYFHECCYTPVSGIMEVDETTVHVVWPTAEDGTYVCELWATGIDETTKPLPWPFHVHRIFTLSFCLG